MASGPPEVSDFDESFVEDVVDTPFVETNSPLAYLVKTNLPKEAEVSRQKSDIGLSDIWREASEKANRQAPANSKYESMSFEVDDVLRSPVFSPKKLNTSGSGKSDTNTHAIKSFKTKETFAGFSDNDEVSQSIGDLQHEFDQIKNKENERSKLVHESSVDFLVKNNLAMGAAGSLTHPIWVIIMHKNEFKTFRIIVKTT